MLPTSVNDLSPQEALAQAINASELLLKELANFDSFEAEQLEKADKLTQVREQLVQKTFAYNWTEEEVTQHHAQFTLLEKLNNQLVEKATNVRYDLHQQRVDNQQGRKAVSAYGTAKGQFHR